MTHDEYDALPGVRWSQLRRMADSPAHYQAALTRTWADTPALALGRLTHTLTLQPELFDSEYAVWRGGRRAGKEYEAWEAQNAGKSHVREQDLDAAQAIATAVRSCPLVQPYLEGARYEVGTAWRDEPTGLVCRALLDWCPPGALLDLKTTRSTDPGAFARSAAQYGYHGQMAHYAEGYRAMTGAYPERVLLVAVESAPPYDVVVYDMAGSLEPGRTWRRTLLDRLADCIASGQYPGRASEILPLDLPAWAGGQDDYDHLDDDGEMP